MDCTIRANTDEMHRSGRRDSGIDLWLLLHLDGFASEAIEEQCAMLDVSAEELARFGLMYYLADLDSGRVARRMTARGIGRDRPIP